MFVLIGSRTVLRSRHIPPALHSYNKAHAGWLSRRSHKFTCPAVSFALALTRKICVVRRVIYGYAGMSRGGQSVEAQVAVLREAGAVKMFRKGPVELRATKHSVSGLYLYLTRSSRC